ncbi:MAG: hypothetical protein AB1791_20450 [Chloroflexota bacterium]
MTNQTHPKATIFMVIVALLLALVACAPAGSPAAADAEPTAAPDQPVTSADPTAKPTPASDNAGQYAYGEAFVESVDVLMLESFPVQVHVVARGQMPEGCNQIDQVKQERQGNTFAVTITTRRPVGMMCSQVLVPFEETIKLDVEGLEAGLYVVVVNGVSGQFELATANGLPGERNSGAPNLPPVTSHGNAIGSYVDLVDALRKAEATVEPAGSLDQAFFTVQGLLVQVNGVEVQVYEYTSEEARLSDSSQIQADGTIVGHSAIRWVAPPHFWAEGRLIVLYVGEDQATIDLFVSLMGPTVNQPPSADVAPAPTPGTEVYPPAVEAAIATLSKDLEVPTDKIEVLSFEAVDWTDSCLGFHEPGVGCLDVIVPGYSVLLSVDGQKYEAHTDLTGERVVWRPA